MMKTTAAMGPRLAGQVQTELPPVVPGAKPVTVDRVKVHGLALAGNLKGNAVDRDVIVFLPPSYSKDLSRRYPVVYALQLPDSKTVQNGSMYSSSVTTGDFERFVAQDLVA